jgi:hypothetical protein
MSCAWRWPMWSERLREGLMAMRVGVGLRVFAKIMEEELAVKAGPNHAKLADWTASRHGSTRGSVVLGGRQVSVTPRAAASRVVRSLSTPTAPSRRTTAGVGGDGAHAGTAGHPSPSGCERSCRRRD